MAAGVDLPLPLLAEQDPSAGGIPTSDQGVLATHHRPGREAEIAGRTIAGVKRRTHRDERLFNAETRADWCRAS